ncbi:MAG: succinate dehydrogenase, cytochrome b556 subunit [Caldilineales bacterium]|nr:succinate dehydrogenase, cytochrome b556 subunit [Caldilineales bacterium]MCW5858628.1 succinate dehydrogenase, cytochrome b556 subunit [Caldilineales bacterium]
MGQAIAALWKGITYRGREGHYAFILHRVAGLGVLLFLVLHIFDIFLMAFGEDAFNDFLALYTHPVARLMEVALIFGVAYHAFNGLRIIIIDFWPRTTVYSRQMWRLVMVISLGLTAVAGYFTLAPLFG